MMLSLDRGLMVKKEQSRAGSQSLCEPPPDWSLRVILTAPAQWKSIRQKLLSLGQAGTFLYSKSSHVRYPMVNTR
jgi:hypothetical protein